MIDEITVSDVALIHEATLTPSPSLTVLTGETGAGKTALISALKLLIGMRADATAVREGAKSARASGRFFPSSTSEELVVTRKVGVDGRSRATINGVMASVSELAGSAGSLVELCGQHEFQSLLKPAEHGSLLDQWAHLEAEASHFQQCLNEARQAHIALDDLLEKASSSNAKLDEARFVVRQIESVDPQRGEYEQIKEWLTKAENAESLARCSHGAVQALSGDGGTLDSLTTAIAFIEEASRDDESLSDLAQSLRESCFVIEDAARDIAAYRDSIEFDEKTLTENQERLGDLLGLMHSFGPTMEAVFNQWEQSQSLINLANDSSTAISHAEQQLSSAEHALAEQAEAYTKARLAAAEPFSQAVNVVLDRLEMGGAQLVCTVTPLERKDWGVQGSSRVVFEFKPGKAMQPRPLARIASGGEISRVMLAIKTALGAVDKTDTLVFDEVDAGVGGSAAKALASVLAELAQTHQVIVVTHLAQVAAVADTHYLVTKSTGAAPETKLEILCDQARVEEIARLLSGSTTEASLTHAQELLDA